MYRLLQYTALISEPLRRFVNLMYIKLNTQGSEFFAPESKRRGESHGKVTDSLLLVYVFTVRACSAARRLYEGKSVRIPS
jgi:hypothetical protein